MTSADDLDLDLDLDADTDDVLDLDGDEGRTLLHDRTYRVRAYHEPPDRLRLRGGVRDRKPPGLYVAGDPSPLVVHHMVVDLVVAYPSLEIVEAEVRLETHPHDECPRIEPRYGELVGLSIARGFTQRVRDLFGGPRGCTHTTALLQAMAPVAIQSTWSMRALLARASGGSGEPVGPPRRMTPEDRQQALRSNLGTCHVWGPEGDVVARLEAGEDIPPPLWAVERLRELGREDETWGFG